MPKSGGSKATLAAGSGGSLLGLWLKLLVNLSFAEDGQQSILRVSGALELLADLAQHRRPALLVLHNLCFCPANKPHVIANGTGIVGLITAALNFVVHIRSVCSIFPCLCSSQYTGKLIRCSCWEIAAKKQICVETDICWCLFVCETKEKNCLQLLILCRQRVVICCVNAFPLWSQHSYDILSRKKCDRKTDKAVFRVSLRTKNFHFLLKLNFFFSPPDKAIKVLLCSLDSKVMETCCMGASGLWALLHNNQRVHTLSL